MLLSKGKMKKKKNKHSKITRIPLYLPIANSHKYLNMFMDILYVNGMVFCMSKTGKIIFLSVTKLTSRNARQIINTLESYKITHK